MTYKEFFKEKKIAIVGLGPHFEMMADIKFLLKTGADVTVYDMRNEATCRHILAELIEVGLSKYAFGIGSDVKPAKSLKPEDPAATLSTISDPASAPASISAPSSATKLAEDLAALDLIILSPDMPATASFLSKARDMAAHGGHVRIEYPQTLFLKLAPPITLIGVTGACGKTTVSLMIYGILKKAFKEYEDQGVYYLDSETPSALSHLKKVGKGDLVVVRIAESLIPAYEEARVSPHVAVITGTSVLATAGPFVPASADIFFHILQFQTYNNFIIGNDPVIDRIRAQQVIQPKAKMLRTGAGIVPSDWDIRYRGAYDRENAALAVRTAELFKVPTETVRNVLESWKGLKGRLELVKKVAGIEFYNDSAANSPGATLAALRTLSEQKNVVLIAGGASEKPPGEQRQCYAELIENIPQYVSTLVLLPGSGTMTIRRDIASMAESAGLGCHYAHGIEDAVRIAREHAARGNRVLFSPGFEASGLEKSRSERGDKFVKAVRGL